MMPGRCPACGKYGLGCDRSAGCYECGYGRRRDVPKAPETAKAVKPWQAEGFDPDRDMTPSGGEITRCGVVVTMSGPTTLWPCNEKFEGSPMGPLPEGWRQRTTGIPGRPDLGYFYAVCSGHAAPEERAHKPIEMTPEGLEALDDGGACTTGHARNKLPDPTSPAPSSGPEVKPPAPDKATEIYNALKKRMESRLAGYTPRIRGVDLCPCGDRRCVDEHCYEIDGAPPQVFLPPEQEAELQAFLAAFWRCDHGNDPRFNGNKRWSRRGVACIECAAPGPPADKQ